MILSAGLLSLYGMAESKEYFRIARISYLEGRVSFQHTNDVDWAAASINMALQPGDRLYTGEDGRAEIEFDDGSVLRLAEKTDVEILSMREQLIQMRVLLGLCSLTTRSSLEFEINTPAAAFTTDAKGNYRFDIAENGDTDAIVRKGELEAVNNQFARRVNSGEMLRVPAADNSREVLARYDKRDAWDEWTDRRNAAMVAYESRRYLPDTVYVGAGDLDRYGRWAMVDGHGYGWIPRVNAYWSPYWEGRWCYRPLWGWTWVSYEPWGWLPYHYGRWHHSVSFGWCWLPGPAFSFHFWSPGLVRFYRGADWVSWCPLGPGDYYNVNHYYYNNTYVYYLNNLRLMQRRGPEDLMNRNSPGAFRGVRTEQFVNSSLGGRTESLRDVPDPSRGGRIVNGDLDIRPTARSYAPAPERFATRPVNSDQRAVVVRTDPEARSANDRFVRVTNPAAARSRAEAVDRGVMGGGRIEPPAGTAARETARDVRVAPNTTSRRTEDIPDRNTAPARVYQAPQTRSMPERQGGSVQRAPDRQEATPRAQQPPAVIRNVPDTPARRMESQPPRVQRNEQSVPSRPQVERSAPPVIRQDAGRPPAQTRPQAPPASKPPDARVIKKNDRMEQMSGAYSQPGRWQSPASVRPAQTWGGGSRNESSGSARAIGPSSPRASYGDAGRPATMRGSPSTQGGGEASRRRIR
jgi:hypothetical protein